MRREILVLKNHLIDANITIHKLQEDNVCSTVIKLVMSLTFQKFNSQMLLFCINVSFKDLEEIEDEVCSLYSKSDLSSASRMISL